MKITSSDKIKMSFSELQYQQSLMLWNASDSHCRWLNASAQADALMVMEP